LHVAVAAMMGKLAHRRVQEGVLVPGELVKGAKVEVYICTHVDDDMNGLDWHWRAGAVMIEPDAEGSFWVAIRRGKKTISEHLDFLRCTNRLPPVELPVKMTEVKFTPWRWPGR